MCSSVRYNLPYWWKRFVPFVLMTLLSCYLYSHVHYDSIPEAIHSITALKTASQRTWLQLRMPFTSINLYISSSTNNFDTWTSLKIDYKHGTPAPSQFRALCLTFLQLSYMCILIMVCGAKVSELLFLPRQICLWSLALKRMLECVSPCGQFRWLR